MQLGYDRFIPSPKLKIASISEQAKSQPFKCGYADIFDGVLEIKIQLPTKGSHKRYCKPQGRSDQGFRHDD